MLSFHTFSAKLIYPFYEKMEINHVNDLIRNLDSQYAMKACENITLYS